VPLVTPADVISVLESDFKDGRDDNKMVSQDDVMFLNKLGSGIQKNTKGFDNTPITLMCDVEKMFHQFHVHETDRDSLRFLWWSNGDLGTEPKEFRMR
ncbi:hypothetical protein NFI96_026651, partial [Prochilodus magdalenae]